MFDVVKAVEEILGFKFKDKKLLEMALTHPSYTNLVSGSYRRLEFVGDAAVELAIVSYAYLTYHDLDPRDLSLITSANVSTEELDRVSILTSLYKYVRHHATSMDNKVLFVLFTFFILKFN